MSIFSRPWWDGRWWQNGLFLFFPPPDASCKNNAGQFSLLCSPVCMRDEYLCHQMGLAGIPLHCGETKHFLITFLCQCNNTIVGIIAGRPGRWQIISPLSTLPTIHWQNIFRFLICRPWRNMNLPAAGDQAANQNKKLIVPVNWWLSGKSSWWNLASSGLVPHLSTGSVSWETDQDF